MENLSSVQSLSRAFNIIELLGESGRGMSIAALCAATGLHKSTVHRLLTAIKAHGYVTKDDNGLYRLTFRVCYLSRKVIGAVSLVSVAKRHLKALCETSQETVHLMLREGNNAVYVLREETLDNTQYTVSSVGKYLPLHTCSVGKCVLANWTEDALADYWREADKRKITENTIDDFDTLREELRVTRERGYAVDNCENTPGSRTIAVVLGDHGEFADAAIAVSGPEERMTDAMLQILRPHVLRARDDIMANMGFVHE